MPIWNEFWIYSTRINLNINWHFVSIEIIYLDDLRDNIIIPCYADRPGDAIESR